MRVTLKLSLTVGYELNGTNKNELFYCLRKIGDLAVGDGLMTGDTEAEVERWEYTVDEVMLGKEKIYD